MSTYADRARATAQTGPVWQIASTPLPTKWGRFEAIGFDGEVSRGVECGRPRMRAGNRALYEPAAFAGECVACLFDEMRAQRIRQEEGRNHLRGGTAVRTLATRRPVPVSMMSISSPATPCSRSTSLSPETSADTMFMSGARTSWTAPDAPESCGRPPARMMEPTTSAPSAMTMRRPSRMTAASAAR